MGWTKTPPIKTGWHYWRKDKTCKWITIDLFKNWQNIGGEWWESPVPEPGTTFSVEWICNKMNDLSRDGTISRRSAMAIISYMLRNHPNGITAVTNKEKHESET